MAAVLDAGALVGYERKDPRMLKFVEVADEEDLELRTTTAVVAQVWRNGAKQVQLARLLKGVELRPLDDEAARRIGELLRVADRSDVVDGSVVDIAFEGDEVLTSDPDDIRALAEASGKRLAIIRV